MRWNPERGWAALYVLGLLGLLLYSAWQLAYRQPVHTDLLMLLPPDGAQSTVQTRAQDNIRQTLNRQIIVLTSATDPARALAAAQKQAQQWSASRLFDRVDLQVAADLEPLRQQLRRMDQAGLPQQAREALARDPQAWFARRAQHIMSPLGEQTLVAADQDWLGFAARLSGKLQSISAVHYDIASNTMQLEADNRIWYVMRAQLDAADRSGRDEQLLALIDQTRQQAASQDVQVLMAGGAIYSAHGKAEGGQESTWMSLTGSMLTILFLLLMFRSARILLLALPVAAGLLGGFAACVALLGSIHILTLIIGTSLVGLVVDFPLHWLSHATLDARWQPWPAVRRVSRPFIISLAVTVTGYLFLLLTPLPILQQTAVFSSAAVISTFLFTRLLLPALFNHWQPRPTPGLMPLLDRLRRNIRSTGERIRHTPLLALLVLAVTGSGLYLSNWHDDIRNWVNTPQPLLTQAMEVGRLTGIEPTSQYFIVQAIDEESLLRTEQRLTARLDPLIAQGQLRNYTALSQWINPVSEQQALNATLATLAQQPQAWAPLRALGVPDSAVRTELQRRQAQPALTIEQSLQGTLAEPWRALWLGRDEQGRPSSMVTMNGLQDPAVLPALIQNIPGVTLVDQRSHINRLFAQTRLEAILLKLLSYTVGFLILYRVFGTRPALRILLVPLSASVTVMSLSGLVGIPLNLFCIFGLLLVTAIGIDYAVYAYTPTLPAEEKTAGIFMTSITTMITFGLLYFSSTPAVATFGLSVVLGVLCNVIYTFWYMRSFLTPESES
ncbi:putative membrane protein [Advenella mimigardefordensis DPN7]|uniref:Putative membrane protein n=2 Tax=Advenella mimigardefordensis TaxID=302406 RepID=W0PKL0_ADVMD|nr:putative membrane protein [Advenella mimigardefordensis DPN7]